MVKIRNKAFVPGMMGEWGGQEDKFDVQGNPTGCGDVPPEGVKDLAGH